MLKIGDFQHFFNFFFNILFSTFFCIFELALQCSFKWSLGAELFLYKWLSYRGSTASKIVHLIAQIVPIQKINPYIFFWKVKSPPKKFAHSPLGVFLAPSLSVKLKIIPYLCYTGNFEILCKGVTYDLKLEINTLSP